MISSEIAIGASIMGVIMIYGSLNMQDIVRGQGQLLFGWLPAWGIVTQPLAFVIFLIVILDNLADLHGSSRRRANRGLGAGR